jgi:hypothetical protein
LLVLSGCGSVGEALTAGVGSSPSPPPIPSDNPPVAAASDPVLEAAVQRQLGPEFLLQRGLTIERVILLDRDWTENRISRLRPVALQTRDRNGFCRLFYLLIEQTEGWRLVGQNLARTASCR